MVKLSTLLIGDCGGDGICCDPCSCFCVGDGGALISLKSEKVLDVSLETRIEAAFAAEMKAIAAKV
jgi:hypothetical protein